MHVLSEYIFEKIKLDNVNILSYSNKIEPCSSKVYTYQIFRFLLKKEIFLFFIKLHRL